MDDEKIRKFRTFFKNNVSGGFELPGLTTKSNLLSSLAKLSNQKPIDVSAAQEELYKDAVWKYLALFRNKKTKHLNPLTGIPSSNGMLFDHSISTDGYSVTLVVSNKPIRGKKHQFRSGVQNKRKAPKKKLSDEFPELNVHTAPKIKVELSLSSPHPPRLLGGDPGKTVLLQLIDQFGDGLRYTRKHRNNDTLCRLRSKKQKSERGAIASAASESAMTIEREMVRNNITPKTWDAARFRSYIAFRDRRGAELRATYAKKAFRSMRFLAWSRRDLSVKRFTKAILEKYGDARQSLQVGSLEFKCL